MKRRSLKKDSSEQENQKKTASVIMNYLKMTILKRKQLKNDNAKDKSKNDNYEKGHLKKD